jgi:hypothetical protein
MTSASLSGIDDPRSTFRVPAGQVAVHSRGATQPIYGREYVHVSVSDVLGEAARTAARTGQGAMTVDADTPASAAAIDAAKPRLQSWARTVAPDLPSSRLNVPVADILDDALAALAVDPNVVARAAHAFELLSRPTAGETDENGFGVQFYDGAHQIIHEIDGFADLQTAMASVPMIQAQAALTFALTGNFPVQAP